MFDTFSNENMSWFYVVPFVVFGPVFFLFLWHFGLKHVLFTPPEVKKQMALEREHKARMSERRENKAGNQARTIHPATLPSKYWLMQGVVYVLFAITLGGFSAWPGYQFSTADEAQIKMSVSHPGQRKEACRKRTAKELQALAPNMRAKMSCTRERWPVELELIVDGQMIFAGTSEPAGLRNDGSSSFYEKVRLKAGVHTLSVRLRDGGPDSEYTYTLTRTVQLAPAQNLIIAFREDGTGLYLK